MQRSRAVGIAALFLTGIVATMVAGLKPILVTAYISSFGLTPKEAGYIVAAEMGGATIGNLAAAWLVSRFSTRRCALLGLTVLCFCNAACAVLPHFPMFFTLRLIAGLAEGVAAGVMAATAAGMKSPDRLMAAYLVLSLGTFAGAFLLIPHLLVSGMRFVFVLLAVAVVPPMCLNTWFPRNDRAKNEAAATADAHSFGLHAGLALFGTMSFYAATGALWPFMGEVGRASHLTTPEVGSVLGMSQLVGAAAGLLPLALGTKLGRSVPLGAALAIGACSIASLLAFHSRAIYWVAVPLFMAALMIFFPYIMGVMAQLDPSGKLSTTSFALQSVGLAIGPAVAGKLALEHGYHAVLWAGLGCIPLAFVALLPVTISQDRRIAS